ncbi:putative peptidoglycan-binding domain-containing protein [Roseofilum sp. BLCC_M154]|uniref:Peptidoglycan-binding domain-containing protein n=1 Tax=Roseofilum acuticapitatum BLCC-M154 TaxID=3022444 RepID=A0ABT7APU5_9CYAN|nr:putative peptidoglycan-binding domain-containing protein [Roseofilum acuticapitatum]MDJ1168905.1 putative peptidoglycan-binding domain-containing protein [Roseofilum acuticapitatum BLCC-M154]
MACLNTAINSGVGKAKEFNELIGEGSVREEAIAYAQRQENYYHDIVSRKPDQEVFLKGWLNRSTDLKRIIE